MTPKEKATEILEKFKPYMYCYMGSGMLSNSYDKNVELNNAKRCALFMVEELIAVSSGYDSDYSSNCGYYQLVKQELLNFI